MCDARNLLFKFPCLQLIGKIPSCIPHYLVFFISLTQYNFCTLSVLRPINVIAIGQKMDANKYGLYEKSYKWAHKFRERAIFVRKIVQLAAHMPRRPCFCMNNRINGPSTENKRHTNALFQQPDLKIYLRPYFIIILLIKQRLLSIIHVNFTTLGILLKYPPCTCFTMVSHVYTDGLSSSIEIHALIPRSQNRLHFCTSFYSCFLLHCTIHISSPVLAIPRSE